MKYRTQLIKLPSDPYLHFMVVQHQTRCGIALEGKQRVLHYEIDGHQVCKECLAKSVPQLRIWNRKKVINDGEHAERLLNRLHILYNIISPKDRVGVGIYMCTTLGSTSIANWLENPHALIEDKLEDQQKLVISYQVKEGREERIISFEDIAQAYEEVVEEVLYSLEGRMN